MDRVGFAVFSICLTLFSVSGHIEVVKLLLSEGVNVDFQGDAGTPLMWAAGFCHHDVVKVLLEHRTNLHAQTEDDKCLLISAVAANSLPCVELLVKAGANVNVKAGDATTPLLIAALNGSAEIINCLLQAGADPNAVDKARSAVSLACKGENPFFSIDEGYCCDPHHFVDGEREREIGAQLEGLQERDLRQRRNIWLKKGMPIREQRKPRLEFTMVTNQYNLQLQEAVGQLLKLYWPSHHVFRVFQNEVWMESLSLWNLNIGENRYLICLSERLDAGRKANKSRETTILKKDLPEVTPEAKKKAAEAKARGDEAFKRNDIATAIDAYTQRFKEAVTAFYGSVYFGPRNKEFETAVWETVDAGRKFHGTDKIHLWSSNH
ncbi:hypothetical protein T459_22165 [Capsicum annuum]|uniref:Uncharacterized protein n=1 Tax=Capsicum annuum TaxID=4072 RepID=A0A2G2YYR5_CAPAN|nr:hypothetical protein T459_22165 [Capsicum annuum]